MNLSGDRSASSSTFTVQDSHYWQDFSYVIKTHNSIENWKDEFLKLVHPAGLKLFTSLIVEASNLIPDYNPSNFLIDPENTDPNDYWKSINWDVAYSNILSYQPGTCGITDLYWIFIADLGFTFFPQRKKITQNDDPNDYRYLVAVTLIAIELQLQNTNPLEYQLRKDYQTWLKNYDDAPLTGYKDHTVNGSMSDYLQINDERFFGIATNPQPNDSYGNSEVITCDLNHEDTWSSSYIRESRNRSFEHLEFFQHGHLESDDRSDITVPGACDVVTHGDQFIFFDTEKMQYSDA